MITSLLLQQQVYTVDTELWDAVTSPTWLCHFVCSNMSTPWTLSLGRRHVISMIKSLCLQQHVYTVDADLGKPPRHLHDHVTSSAATSLHRVLSLGHRHVTYMISSLCLQQHLCTVYWAWDTVTSPTWSCHFVCSNMSTPWTPTLGHRHVTYMITSLRLQQHRGHWALGRRHVTYMITSLHLQQHPYTVDTELWETVFRTKNNTSSRIFQC